MKFFEKAYELAQWAHADQFRRDGKPYMTHIDEVIANTKKIFERLPLSNIEYMEQKNNLIFGEIYELFLSVAANHDSIFEDQIEKFQQNPNKLKELEFINPKIYNHFIVAVRAISKYPKGQEEYFEYVLRVKNNYYAKIVKIADLKHNMSDLKPGNLRDKYSLTLYYLENH